MSVRREDAAALMDGRYRLRACQYEPVAAGRHLALRIVLAAELDDPALVWDRFVLAQAAARIAAALRPEWVVFVVQGGRHVWASDGRVCSAEPEDF